MSVLHVVEVTQVDTDCAGELRCQSAGDTEDSVQ